MPRPERPAARVTEPHVAALFARRTPFGDQRSQFLAGRFGMGLFLSSLGMLFGATLLAFLVLRLEIGRAWPTLPALPAILWLSTLTIVVSSATMQWGLRSIRNDRRRALPSAMLLTFALGVGFLVMQTVAWLQWLVPAAERWGESNEWRFALTSFYIFTGLHAAHVVGGLIPMAVVTSRAMRGRYSSAAHSGVQYCTMYWHFLDAVWLALFASLLLGV